MFQVNSGGVPCFLVAVPACSSKKLVPAYFTILVFRAYVPTYGSKTYFQNFWPNHSNCTLKCQKRSKKYASQFHPMIFPTSQLCWDVHRFSLPEIPPVVSEESQGLARFHVPLGGAGSTRDGRPRQRGLSLQLRGGIAPSKTRRKKPLFFAAGCPTRNVAKGSHDIGFLHVL